MEIIDYVLLIVFEGFVLILLGIAYLFIFFYGLGVFVLSSIFKK